MHWHLAALLTAIRNHPRALPIYLAAWGLAIVVMAARWGF